MSSNTKNYKIYLDLNIYRHLIELRRGYYSIKKKIISLKSTGCIFPYSAAHMEEIAVMFRMEEEDRPKNNLIKKHINLIEEISSNYELRSGRPSLKTIEESRRHFIASAVPISPEMKAVLDDTEREWRSGLLSSQDLKTRLIIEHPSECLNRVLCDIRVTDDSHRMNVFYMGRRNENSIKKNFAEMKLDAEGIPSFKELQDKYEINIVELNNLSGADVFLHEGVQAVLKESCKQNNISFDAPSANTLMDNHELLVKYITIYINVLDKVRYSSDKQNDVLKLRSSMHDVSHAIYGAVADILVTDDIRFAKRLYATYAFLGIPTRVLSSTEFIEFDYGETL